MKAQVQRLLLLLVFSALVLSVGAVVSEYSFASSIGTFTEISGGTVHGTVANDNDNFNAVPLGFSFTYDGVVYESVSIQCNGFLAMGPVVANSTTPISSATGTNNVVSALGRDIKSRDNGELMSITTGTAPNRVFIAQWNHYRRIPATAATDDLIFQIQLHEGTNKVVFVYGTFVSNTSTTAPSVQVGLRGAANTDFNNRLTTTDWSATTVGTAANSACTLSATVFPAPGLTFTFTPPASGDVPLAAQNPVPANNAVNVAIGANLSWVTGGGTVDGYKVYLGTNPEANNIVNGTTQTAITYNPEDFSYSTTYYWKIVPYNAVGDALNCPTWSFTTLADPTVTVFPYAQGFDDVTPPAQALGWTTINGNNDTYTWESVAGGTQAGANAMRCRFNSTLAMDDWLVSPPLTLTGGNVYKVRFYYRANGATTPEKLSVYSGTTPTAAGMTNMLWENLNINSTTWAMAEGVISAATTGNYYVGFHGHSNALMNYIYLDTFSIFQLIDVINPPQNFTANVVNENDVVLAWAAPAMPSRDFLGYKLYRNTTLVNTFSPATLTYTDMDLAVGNYSYTLTAIYDGGESTPAGPVQVTTSAMLPPANLAVSLQNYNNVHLTWDAPGTEPPVNNFTDDFESYANFTLTFAPWTLVDVDLSATYGFSGITFQNSGSAMAYIIFNPSATTPALEQTPHSGAKMAACFASTTPPNNDWMITPSKPVMAGDVVKFWARSYVADYGLERFKVGVSTTGTAPANFTIISGASYISAPITWTEYTYSLAAYAGQSVKIGIQCLSNDAFIFFVDDVFVGAPALAPSYPEVPVSYATVGRAIVSPNVNKAVSEEPTRALLGYKVYRNSALIATVSSPTTLSYDDLALAPGPYSYTVTAYYDGGESTPAGPVNVTALAVPAPVTNFAANVTGSTVALTWTAPTATTCTGYKLYRNNVLLTEITDPATVSYTQNNVPNGEYVYGILAVHNYGESVTVTANAVVNVTLAPAFFTEGFEGYDDFSLQFSPWILKDLDLSTTYGIQNVTFTNSGSAMAYIVFNPTTTTPPVTSVTAHGGVKMAASFAATAPPNNDYLITPYMHLGTGSAIKFWAKSHTAQYGLERFRVGVSTNVNALPATFQYVTGANEYVEAPLEWTEYTYDLSAWDGQNVYITIRCVSNDAFIFYVDDVSIHGVGGSVDNSDITTPVVATELKGNYPNPFNPETTIKYSVSGNTPVSIEIYNVKGQLVKTLVNETKGTGNYSEVWKGLDNNNRPVSSGVYFFKMNAGKYSSTKKMIMMK